MQPKTTIACISILISAALLSIEIAPPSYASTPRLPNSCRFRGTNPPLKANASWTVGDFHYATIDGLNIWNRSSIQTKITASEYGANIRIKQMSVSQSYWAVTDVSGCSGGYWPTTRDITLNDATMSQLTAREKRIVIQHELGHALGLGHPSGTLSCSNPSMMYQGTAKFKCSTDPIWNSDAITLNRIYASS